MGKRTGVVVCNRTEKQKLIKDKYYKWLKTQGGNETNKTHKKTCTVNIIGN